MDAEPKGLQTVVSYAHGLHDAEVHALADKLTRMGVPCDVDLFELRPAGGWSVWMADKMTSSEIVLVVCSEPYYRRYHRNEPRGVGQGATFESRLLTRRVLEAQGSEHGVIPILFDALDSSFVPEVLRDETRFILPRDFDNLYRVLTGQGSPYVRPPLGQPQRLPNIEPTSLNRSLLSSTQLPRLVLIHHDGEFLLIPYTEISREGRVFRIVLAPRDGEEWSALGGLRETRRTVSVAYNLTAVEGGIRCYRDYTGDGKDLVEIQIYEAERGGVIEIQLNDKSADDIALLRARRILLNEKLPVVSDAGDMLARMNAVTLESYVSGSGNNVSMVAKASPIPVTVKPDSGPETLAGARLCCVLMLILGGAVERISRLELSIVSEGVQVDFAGVRRKQYDNVDAPVLTVEGHLSPAGLRCLGILTSVAQRRERGWRLGNGAGGGRGDGHGLAFGYV